MNSYKRLTAIDKSTCIVHQSPRDIFASGEHRYDHAWEHIYFEKRLFGFFFVTLFTSCIPSRCVWIPMRSDLQSVFGSRIVLISLLSTHSVLPDKILCTYVAFLKFGLPPSVLQHYDIRDRFAENGCVLWTAYAAWYSCTARGVFTLICGTKILYCRRFKFTSRSIKTYSLVSLSQAYVIWIRLVQFTETYFQLDTYFNNWSRALKWQTIVLLIFRRSFGAFLFLTKFRIRAVYTR